MARQIRPLYRKAGKKFHGIFGTAKIIIFEENRATK